MGTVVKTTAKYQDTGNAGVAALEATQNIVCTVIPVARQATMSKAVKTVISTTMDAGKALLEGKSLGTAIAAGAVNVPTAAGGELAKKGLQTVLGKTAVPVVVKVAEDQAKKALQGWVKSRGASGTMAQDARMVAAGSAGLCQQVSLEDDLPITPL